jgi:hypothetical protein
MSCGIKENGILTETLQERRNKIIVSVLTKGLKSSYGLDNNSGFIGSGDNEKLKIISGRVIREAHANNSTEFHSPIEDYELDIQLGLYFNGYSVFPVLQERPWNGVYYRNFYTDPHNADLLSKRCLSSFLVVCKFDSQSTNISTSNSFYPNDFLGVIFPFKIWEEYGHQLDNISNGLKVITTNQITERIVGRLQTPIIVPDYESILRLLSRTESGAKWIHGVRLPTNEDMDHIL